ncbi:recombinase family protein [Streptomyces sp. MS06]|uniref:recombinase family protein n=1 Tax=Streptomyces sp. MS06 TaxID=3385974 RepID=UPI00399EEB8A
MRGTDLNTIERPYDGCGKCLLGVRRLSRVKLATSSPERQRENVLTAAAAVGAHIIGWADDWEVSGATDPVTRPSLGPWLRDERGPYDGLVAAAVDRLGRNVVDCLNTGYKMRDEKKMLVTYGHDGAWNRPRRSPVQLVRAAWRQSSTALGARVGHGSAPQDQVQAASAILGS